MLLPPVKMSPLDLLSSYGQHASRLLGRRHLPAVGFRHLDNSPYELRVGRGPEFGVGVVANADRNVPAELYRLRGRRKQVAWLGADGPFDRPICRQKIEKRPETLRRRGMPAEHAACGMDQDHPCGAGEQAHI